MIETSLDPVLAGENFRVFNGNCIDVLKTLPEKSINCCVTSPPYWGLRDYGTAQWEGGDPNCEHTISMPTKWNDPKRGTSVLRPEVANRGGDSSACHLCGALRIDEQIGLEQSPEDYISSLVSVFREVHRVLTDDGVLWLNLGDSYAGNNSRASNNGRAGYGNPREGVFTKTGDGLKPKDLVGIPWMAAFALRNDGWWLRQDIIWHKPNPMPESVTDRCTKAHEYIFMLTKSPRYYFDNEAIKQPVKQDWGTRDRTNGKYHNEGSGLTPHSGLTKSYQKANKRSVWSVTTRPYKGSHFAVFPPELIEPCILAGCPEGGIVLDPFGGSGTTASVSLLNGRNAIAIELNPDYIPLIDTRINDALRVNEEKNNQLSLFDNLPDVV